MTDNDSFVAKLLKARYYTGCSFRDANLGSNPSYVWRSIFAAKELVLEGSILKVGSGETIKVWEDPWIPDIDYPKISSPIFVGLEDIRVNNLFLNGEKQWDRALISDIFNERDVMRILSIPLSRNSNLIAGYGCMERKADMK